MAKFDPLKPPMSLQESERLLKGYEQSERDSLFWKSFFFGTIKLVGAVIGIGIVTLLAVNFSFVAWVVGVIGVIYAIGAIASADRK